MVDCCRGAPASRGSGQRVGVRDGNNAWVVIEPEANPAVLVAGEVGNACGAVYSQAAHSGFADDLLAVVVAKNLSHNVVPLKGGKQGVRGDGHGW